MCLIYEVGVVDSLTVSITISCFGVCDGELVDESFCDGNITYDGIVFLELVGVILGEYVLHPDIIIGLACSIQLVEFSIWKYEILCVDVVKITGDVVLIPIPQSSAFTSI